MGDAQCVDVGCSGPGKPTFTSLCRLDYSSCSAGVDEMSFELQLQTDNKGRKTTWKINDDSDIVWQSETPYRNFASIVEYIDV